MPDVLIDDYAAAFANLAVGVDPQLPLHSELIGGYTLALAAEVHGSGLPHTAGILNPLFNTGMQQAVERQGVDRGLVQWELSTEAWRRHIRVEAARAEQPPAYRAGEWPIQRYLGWLSATYQGRVHQLATLR